MGNTCPIFGRTYTEDLDPTLQDVRIELFKEPADVYAIVVYSCLNTTVLKALKIYVPPVAQILYDELVDTSEIDRQRFPNILHYYQAYRLEYAYINRNVSTESYRLRHQLDPLWNYMVGSPVDLTKLLLSHKKSYVDFSNCDVADLLEIIVKIHLFPAQVRIKAIQLTTVRNSVAHFVTNEWTNQRFIYCIDQMVDFVNFMDIPEQLKRTSVQIIKRNRDGVDALVIDNTLVDFTFRLVDAEASATIHGFNDEQQRRALHALAAEDNDQENNKSSFAITATSEQSIRLDLTSDMAIYNSPKTFKIAVYKLLHRVIKASGFSRKEEFAKASGVRRKENVYLDEEFTKAYASLDVEFDLPKTLTEEQLVVVAEAFPRALDQKVVKAIKMKREAHKWKTIREKTIPELEKIEQKLNEAAYDLENFRRGRNFVAGVSFFGGILAAPFTGGASLAVLGLAFGTVAFVVSFVFEKHLTGEVMKNVQVAIDIDIATTKMLREQAQQYATMDEELARRLLEHFPGIILTVLAVSFSDFIKGFIDSTADSVRRTKDQVTNLRRNLEEELRKVEEMLQKAMIEVPVEAKRHH